METPFEALTELARSVRRRVDSGPVATRVPARTVRAHLDETFDLSRPMGLAPTFREVEHMLQRWQVQVTHPRYFGLYNPSVTTASILADALVAAYNPQLAAWSHSPAACEIERFTLRAIGERIGFDPDTTASHFTSGGGEANLTGVITSLAHSFPDWAETGVRGLAGQPCLYISEEGHHSVHKAVRVVGLGNRAVRQVETDSVGRMRVEGLERRIAEDRADGLIPWAVVATAGTTGSGAIDPVDAIADLCARERLWLHVDAAWAGAAALSPELARHLGDLSRADSLTCDAHKWLAVPMGAGMFFCRHRKALATAFTQRTPYMPATRSTEIEDPFAHTLQWSRRFIGLKLFVTLAEVGFPGVIERIEHQTRLGRRLRQRLSDTGWEIANETPLPVVCFQRPGLDVKKLVSAIHHEQLAWMSPIRIAGGPLLVRACVTGYRTTEEDVDAVVTGLNQLL